MSTAAAGVGAGLGRVGGIMQINTFSFPVSSFSLVHPSVIHPSACLSSIQLCIYPSIHPSTRSLFLINHPSIPLSSPPTVYPATHHPSVHNRSIHPVSLSIYLSIHQLCTESFTPIFLNSSNVSIYNLSIIHPSIHPHVPPSICPVYVYCLSIIHPSPSTIYLPCYPSSHY